jgi:EmrB/QacA subfamily drug resistance transporter
MNIEGSGTPTTETHRIGSEREPARSSEQASARSRQRLTLLTMCLAAAMTFLEITATISSLTAIQADLGISTTDLVWVASAYTLPVASLVLTAGTLGGLYGRKRVLAIGVGVIMLGSLVVATAPTIGMVLLGQGIAGVGGALVLPNSVALLTITFTDPHQRTEAIGLWAASSGIGLAAGPVISGFVLAHYSWHHVFLTNVALGAVTLGLALRAVPESRHPGQRLDPAGLLVGSLAVCSLVFAAIEGGHRGYAHPVVVTALTTFVLATLVFVAVELRHTSPMLDLDLFRSRSFSAVMFVAAVALFGFTGVSLLFVLFFQRVQSLSALDTGLRLLPEMIAFVLASAVTGRLVRRVGFTPLLTLGLALAGTASLAMLSAGPRTGYLTLGTLLAAFGTGLGLVVASSTAAAMTSIGPAHASMASGALNTFRQVGAVLGTSVLGTILATRSAADLPVALSQHGVAAQEQPLLLAAAADGRLDPDTVTAGVHAALGQAFTTGLHAGLLVNGSLFLLAALVAACLIRHQPHES